MDVINNKEEIEKIGFTVINNVFTEEETEHLINVIQQADSTKETFRKTKDLFAIRQFLKEIPAAATLTLNRKLWEIIAQLFGDGYGVVKSIYFDKPGDSNWFVAYHQDLTISVNQKTEVAGYGPWSVKQNQYAVQPPLSILENNFTIRIHLDDTDENNGALRIIPGSHRKGIYRAETIDWRVESEVVCNVLKGGVMIMRPLLLHASSRTNNNHKRRVVHLEFSNQQLPAPLCWSEAM
ncbi:Phytanoyl-CoA dioxygenase (PhyH) [Chitinophaga sp. CF118]|uniref:phytanoyl-CoA dioxygenase family protein n=1 Tax=Chitinophaga sp. CF118 TaxID=1884367 RepID=UPI0008F27556|nr:phytanoyl-CoA dioxygenase family protein [Chitinophaga sp. CF118]SFD31808.1 Phytanoyl-CoA dioxygenase (PhyH) [Chitinophaga sp. CF118]